MPPPLLLTRPEADARRFAALLPGWPAVIAPILRIEPVAHDAQALAEAPGLVFTSAHAVPAAGAGRGRPAICVGAQTGAAARAAGFSVTEGQGTAASLLPLIAAASVPLIHPHGRHLARALPVPGMVVYDQVPQPLGAEAEALLAGAAPVILPVFSPRSARLLAEAVATARAPLWLAAISAAADDAFAAPAAQRALAPAPSAAGMVAAIRGLAAAERS
ncbi:uroporphyrinogen-III synthase [Paracoccus tibetensis]|uniref:Uroporphyrinogen-III synthase n=1 Tax=Paracoccus tibetensis TaxID=336292 RepID=A0A1G5IZP9_9RHOB|nr:uroporphyrinogen-III synthase [Paracoccus tibetensis]SCY81190.1 uroporphyrinogen-III synthase [Paracoccus tibetensis]